MKPILIKYIDSAPGKCGGKPCIAGTRIRVWDIYVAHELRGETAEQIVAAYPHITLAQIHAALAYYWDHKDEIDRQMKEADRVVDQLRRAAGPGPLAAKLFGKDAGDASVPSR